MSWVLISLLALGLGPALVVVARKQRWVLGVVDGFVMVTIGGIVLLHILPHAFLIGGWAMLVLAAVGLLGPALFERTIGPRLPTATRWMLPLALLGLSLHAFVDGAVLVEAAQGHNASHGGHEHAASSGGWIALGVVLHRIPEGLASWWVFRQRYGVRGALLALTNIGAATTLGFFLGEQLEGHLGVLHGLQALVAGSLLHVIFHRSHDFTGEDGALLTQGPTYEEGLHPQRFSQIPAAIGALLGVAILWGISLAHPALHPDAETGGAQLTFFSLSLKSAPALLSSYIFIALVHAFGPSDGEFRSGGKFSELGLALFFFGTMLLGGRELIFGVVGVVVFLLFGWLRGDHSSKTSIVSHLGERRDTFVKKRIFRGVLYASTEMVDSMFPWVLLGLGGVTFLTPLLAGAVPGEVIFASWLVGAASYQAATHRLTRSWAKWFAALLGVLSFALAVALGVVVSTAGEAPGESTSQGSGFFRVGLLVLFALLALASLVRRGPRFWVEKIWATEHPHLAMNDGATEATSASVGVRLTAIFRAASYDVRIFLDMFTNSFLELGGELSKRCEEFAFTRRELGGGLKIGSFAVHFDAFVLTSDEAEECITGDLEHVGPSVDALGREPFAPCFDVADAVATDVPKFLDDITLGEMKLLATATNKSADAFA